MLSTTTKADIDRQSKLDKFLKRYLMGENKVDLYREYEAILRSAKPLDLFHISHFEIGGLLPIDEIRRHAGRFVNLFSHGLNAYVWDRSKLPLIRLLLLENEAIMERLLALKPSLARDQIEKATGSIEDFLGEMAELDKKFIKMQNVIFPVMEAIFPKSAVFKVLWIVHDDLVEKRDKLLELLRSDPYSLSDLIKAIGEYYYELAGLIQKEDAILFPVMSEVMGNEQLEAMLQSCYDIGYAFLKDSNKDRSSKTIEVKGSTITTNSGKITLEQFLLIMGHLPISITYVDEFDKVVYYNEQKTRHFPRTPQAIGREVRNCHPEKSVHIVEEIIKRFRDGSKDQAVFWFDHNDHKLLIRYLAVRDEHGRYRGVLETSEDITEYGDYQGVKRLLDWE